MYIDTLARLNAAIAFKSSDEDSREKVCLLLSYRFETELTTTTTYTGPTRRDWYKEADTVVYKTCC